MIYISKILKIIVPALLASLGYSCIGWFAAEYGCPNATYKAKGIVVSDSDGSPIEGIRASLFRDTAYENYEEPYPIATAYTNSSGFFFLEGSEFPRLKLYLELLDLDGELNGSFERMEIKADYSIKTFTGGDGHWYEGEATIDFETIKMLPE